MGPPKVQATYMKQFAARVELLGAPGEEVVAADPELFAEIEAASRLSWLPASLNVRMIDALVKGLGPKRAHQFQADQITSQFSTPLWRGFVEGGIRTLGLDPAALSRWIPNALRLIFKDCGEWRVERLGETSATLHARWLPDDLTQGSRWIESIAGGTNALFILCRTSGEATVVHFDPETGAARIELHWKAVVQ
jgi:hypothetical protein